ncbi:MAG: chitobiase/beta-hexosaminidase C-terminal domain-containing protein, partial [Actinomycetota bacterium]|nr:chitobiase/beta-hexosaminidase C-terminal domain-containing protein [Actinomycetota bacterium]
MIPASQAATVTKVSLTFDNNTISEFTLGYQQALQPRGMHATFFINSGTVASSSNFLTWAQLSTLQTAGNEIGGKTIHSINLKTTTDFQTKVDEVCNDRQAILQHGLSAVSFAYPGGSFDQTAKDIVRNCGYGNARTAGGAVPTGPVYAETLPPADYFATRAYAPNQVTLANLQTLVTNASTHGGGWEQIVIGKVCDQALDPSRYSNCITSSGNMELGQLTQFLDWIVNAGQPGGAPAGTSIDTVRNVVTAADTVAPVTTIACNGSPCGTGQYPGPVTVSLSATDAGSGVSSTHYTTDGSTPTLASPTYTAPFTLSAAATVKFASWDNAGNAEATKSQFIQATPPPQDTTPPVTTISCNSAPCSGGAYGGPVTVALTATDGGGWGVDKTYYTTDGSAPSQTSPVYSQPFQLMATTTVRFFSTDLAGNAEQAKSQVIQAAPSSTVVSLTFDDGDRSQYELAFQRGLQPHTMRGTFYITSSFIDVNSGAMTWSQITDMASNSQEVGGHTVHHVDLTSTSTSRQSKVNEVCDDRQALIQHGFSPVSFAYPFGAYNQEAKDIVQSCGYLTARGTGGLPASGPYAETIPPLDPFATRTITAADSGPITLAYLQNAVNAAAAHGGGWVPFVFHEVCSQTYAPSDYNTCMATFRPMELATFNAFLDWLQNGAPAGTKVQTVQRVIVGPDTQAPTTSISCNGGACSSGPYASSVTVALSATDAGGSGVDKTYYTTNGSTPTTSSTVYTAPFQVGSTSTVKFFSTDVAGN